MKLYIFTTNHRITVSIAEDEAVPIYENIKSKMGGNEIFLIDGDSGHIAVRCREVVALVLGDMT